MIGDDGEVGEVALGVGWTEDNAGADRAEEVAEWAVEVRDKRNSNQVSAREFGN